MGVGVIPAGLSDRRRRICEVAIREIGTREEPRASNRGPVEKYFPAWQRAALDSGGYRAKGPAWCAFFVGWVWIQALGGHPLGAHVGAVRIMRVRAQERGLWLGMGGAEDADQVHGPAPGDAFCILHGVTGHTGIILRVSESGKEWVTVEGNTGHAVKLGRRSVGDPDMTGVISVLGDLGTGDWEVGLGDVETEDVSALGTR